MKIEIEFDTLKRIAKASPDLTMAQFVAVWSEKIAEEKREQDRERKKEKPGIQTEPAGNDTETDGMPPTRQDEEKRLFADANAVLGRNANGMVAALLKANRYQIEPVRAILNQARTKGDPRGYVAAALRKQSNGTGPNLMDAFDRLDDRAAGEALGAGDEIRDITPGSH